MTERTNEDRARAAWHICTKHYDGDELTGMNTEYVREAIASVLSDCRHLCDTVGLSFGECDRLAHQRYLEEKHNAPADKRLD